jgi:hypothetical protein
MHSMGQKTAASPQKQAQERARHAAVWLSAYSEANPSTQFACRMFGTNPSAVRKATEAMNGNGNGHAPAPLTIDDVARWWLSGSDADRAALVKLLGVGNVWRAIESNL